MPGLTVRLRPREADSTCMSEESGRIRDTDDLRQDVADRRRRAGEAVGRTSSVPVALFGPCDPMVEARLLDDAIQLLRHMSVHDAPPNSSDEAPPQLPENEITSDDVRDLLGRLKEIASEDTPDLLENLPQESLCILADIAMTSSGLARHRATLGLRSTLENLWDDEDTDLEVMQQMVSLLDDVSRQHASTLVFKTLRDSAARAVEKRTSQSIGPEGE